MPREHEDTAEILAQQRNQDFPPTIHRVQRRVFGVEPLPLLFVGTALALVLALALFVSGDPIPAIVLLVTAGGLAVFVRTGIRRDPESWVARGWRRSSDRGRSQARLLAVAIRAWSAAGARLVRVRVRRAQLRHQLRGQLRPLGEAVYRNEAERARAIKARAAALERELLESRHEDSLAVGVAREAIDRERALVGPTEGLPRQSE